MDAIVVAQKETANELAEAQDVLGLLRGLFVTNEREQVYAAEVLQEVKKYLVEIERKRTAITVPLNTALKEVNNLFRPVRKAYEEGEQLLKQRLAGYLAEREKENQRALQAAAVARTAKEATEALARIETVTAPKGINVRYVWKFEIVNPDLVPREFCSPDPRKLGEVEAETPIPGVEWRQEPVVSARR